MEDGTTLLEPEEWLQWGRRLSPTEDAPSAGFSGMLIQLQWGRRLSPTEEMDADAKKPHPLMLQWGRRLSPTEDCFPGKNAQLTDVLQWGRRLSPTEDDDLVRGVAVAVAGASMGPPAFTDGRGSRKFSRGITGLPV